MKETTSMHLKIYQYDVTVIYVTLNVKLFNAVLSLDTRYNQAPHQNKYSLNR